MKTIGPGLCYLGSAALFGAPEATLIMQIVGLPAMIYFAVVIFFAVGEPS